MEDASRVAETVPLLGVASETDEHREATFVDGTTINHTHNIAESNGVKGSDEKDSENRAGGDEKENKNEDEKDKAEGEEDKKKEENIRIRTKDIGVWRIFYQDQPWSYLPGADLFRQFKGMAESLPYFWRFTKEMWTLAPGYLLLWVFLRTWESIDGAVSLWITANLLNTMQAIILTGIVDKQAVQFAFVLKFCYFVSKWIQSWIFVHSRTALNTRIENYCGAKLLEAYTRMDLVTLQRKDVQSRLRKMTYTFIGDAIWDKYRDIMNQMLVIVEVLSQGWFLGTFFKQQDNGWTLAAVCVLPQVIKVLLYNEEFGGVWFAHAFNKAYIRVRAIGDTARTKEYFEEIISSGLGKYIQKEYKKAMDELGDVPHQHIYHLIWARVGYKDFLRICLSDAPLLYYFAAVARNPASFSLTSLTVMRESADSFMYTIWNLIDRSDESLNDKLRFIQDYYSLVEMKNVVVDGYLPYPAPAAIESGSQGMKIEFKNVSMKYPHSTSYALKNLSFTIPAGATVIIVGANGSGKTTTVSLLSRLMDPTSGEILIDDIPLKNYQVQTIRDAQAVLRQSYQHFPFSVKENIGMGDPNWLDESFGTEEDREEKIMRAARLGGADEIIEEIRGLNDKRRDIFKDTMINGTKGSHQHLLDASHRSSANNSSLNLSTSANGDAKQSKDGEKKVTKDKDVNGEAKTETKATSTATANGELKVGESGWDINVTPVRTWEGSWQIHGSKLGEMSEEIEKSIELSGGQWQRMALARLFMRAEGEKIKLICTDEPSAALDPRAEFEVFQRLRTLKGRKTTRIFITHRFGHLTKHADLILCLKKGELVEMGSHDELIKANGEYANLYNIQAQAFATDPAKPSEPEQTQASQK